MTLSLTDEPVDTAVFDVKVCSKCNTTRPVSDFWIKDPESGRRHATCRFCMSEYQKNWSAKNPGKRAEYNLRNHPTRSLTLAQWERKVADQQGLCAICRKPETKRRKGRLSVDHDHVTSVRRGLLCDDCNNMLGRAHDNPDVLMAAIAYLAKWSN